MKYYTGRVNEMRDEVTKETAKGVNRNFTRQMWSKSILRANRRKDGKLAKLPRGMIIHEGHKIYNVHLIESSPLYHSFSYACIHIGFEPSVLWMFVFGTRPMALVVLVKSESEDPAYTDHG